VLIRAGRQVEVPAVQRTYTDGINGETVWTYHARLAGLEPGATYQYAVTADNSGQAAEPLAAHFTTAPSGRQPFRFTSFGDLATPNTAWVLSYGQSAYAVDQVEVQQPLFHLLNGDLCYANLNPTTQPEVWRDFGNNNQTSAAFRPWMPCPGNHELEFDNGPQGLNSYLTRYTLPGNGVPGFAGRWYSFRVSNALFVSLAADDVIYQDGAAFVAGPSPLVPIPLTGNPPIPPGSSVYVRGYSGGAQTRWLQRTLANARQDPEIDWIIVQMHQDALSSSITGNGSDLGIRQEWLPLFDRYEVDLVLCGHDHDYERSLPVRGYDPKAGWDNATGATLETLRPHPVTTVDSGSIDTSQGTVHLILGGGGTSAPLDDYGFDTGDGQREAKIFTFPNRPRPTTSAGVYARAAADAREDAIWSAVRDPSTGYGIAVFDLNPEARGVTTIDVTYLHAIGADPVNPTTGVAGAPTAQYSVFERFTLFRPVRQRGFGQRSGNRETVIS
jgi:3',5'-cyclic AMP phosphodiesterase CpdA